MEKTGRGDEQQKFLLQCIEKGNEDNENKKDYDEWFANQQKKDLLSDALGERGIGVDPGSGGRIRIVGKKGNGVGHA